MEGKGTKGEAEQETKGVNYGKKLQELQVFRIYKKERVR